VVDAQAVNTLAEWILNLAPPVAGSLPAPWVHDDVGSVGVTGDATYVTNGAVFNVSGSGTDIWGTADGFHFVYQNIAGDADVVARVTGVSASNPWAKAGVMIRESLAPGSRNVMHAMTAQNGVEFQWRDISDGNCNYAQGPALTTPSWIRLTRTGTVFRAYHSLDGQTWTSYGSANVSMGSNVLAGLAVSAVNNAALNASSFDFVSVLSAANADTDRDGMPDAWENANGLNPNNPSDAAQDSDSDGMTNQQEYLAGTNPRNGSSVFRIAGLTRLTNDLVLRFNTVNGRTYAIERASGVPPTNWLSITNVASGSDGILSITNKGAGSGNQGYFRIRITP
jgi:hypothetical protein